MSLDKRAASPDHGAQTAMMSPTVLAAEDSGVAIVPLQATTSTEKSQIKSASAESSPPIITKTTPRHIPQDVQRILDLLQQKELHDFESLVESDSIMKIAIGRLPEQLWKLVDKCDQDEFSIGSSFFAVYFSLPAGVSSNAFRYNNIEEYLSVVLQIIANIAAAERTCQTEHRGCIENRSEQYEKEEVATNTAASGGAASDSEPEQVEPSSAEDESESENFLIEVRQTQRLKFLRNMFEAMRGDSLDVDWARCYPFTNVMFLGEFVRKMKWQADELWDDHALSNLVSMSDKNQARDRDHGEQANGEHAITLESENEHLVVAEECDDVPKLKEKEPGNGKKIGNGIRKLWGKCKNAIGKVMRKLKPHSRKLTINTSRKYFDGFCDRLKTFAYICSTSS
ncbi:hypothetical protein HK102_001983 [Quaeritorhiza haematococci]|nr:hypothetical protein HK102_001983 [Quaeritorhiza haematococci]